MKRLNTQLNELTNQNSLKSPKLLSNELKTLLLYNIHKTLGTSVIKIPMYPSFLIITSDDSESVVLAGWTGGSGIGVTSTVPAEDSVIGSGSPVLSDRL